MRIYSTNISTNNQKMFRGLWGKEKTNSYYDSLGQYYDVDKFYYPFADESNRQISKIVKQNSSYKSSSVEDLANAKQFVANPIVHYEQTTVKVMEKLPFTASEYAQYQQNKLSGLKSSVIKHCIEFLEKAGK